jgi:lipopolysaccharide transport system ATP-binding protein
MSDIVIQVEDVSKCYRLGVIGTGTLAHDLNRWWARVRGRPDPTLPVGQQPPSSRRSPVHGKRPSSLDSTAFDARSRSSDYIWALKGVSFDVHQGEVLGIIGRNGAGKSTVLKILSRVTAPTSGEIRIRGRIASLLEIGTGFHPELTGRENIKLNGAILGMRSADIARRFDEIVDFSGSEVEQYIDTPVKRYSSGMYLRLAFAVAAHLDPEILIVDEILAVGDAAFQKKCLGKMGGVASEGRTVLFVSHNMAAVESLCSRAMLLEHGMALASGPTGDVVDTYLSLVASAGAEDLGLRKDRSGSGKLRFTGLGFHAGKDAGPTDVVRCGEDLEFVVDYRAAQNLKNVSMSIVVYTLSGQVLFCLGNEMAGNAWETAPQQGRMSCLVRRLPLAPGQYAINLHCEANQVLADWVQNAGSLTVEEGDFFGTGKLPPASHAGLLVDQEWTLNGA